MFEVENKFPIDDLNDVEARLVALGCEFAPAIEQRDCYFNHPQRDFAETDEALRIRSVGDENCLTYKGPKVDTATKTRREIEPALGAGAGNAERVSEVLIALGFRPVHVVEKRRRIAEIVWQEMRVEIALDNVDGLGDFLEIEITVEEAQLAAAQTCLASLAEHLELSAPERRSYLEMLLAKS